MLISDFLNEQITAAAAEKNLAKDYRAVRKSLSAYLGDKFDKADILEMGMPGWGKTYYDFLKNDYQPNISNTTLLKLQAEGWGAIAERRMATSKNHIKILRRLVRIATEKGYFPPIDVLSELPDFKRVKPVVAPDIRSEMKSLAQSQGKAYARLIDTYMLCICLGGAMPSQLRKLQSQCGQNHGSVLLPTIGIEITLSPWLQHKLASLSLADTLTDEAILAEMRRLFAALDTRLLANSPYSDWLYLMSHTKNADQALLQRFIEAATTGATLNEDEQLSVRYAIEAIAAEWEKAESSKQRKYWFAIKAFGRTGEELENEILGRGAGSVQPDKSLAASLANHTYCPCIAIKKDTGRRKNNSPLIKKEYEPRGTVMKSILFVYAADETIDLLVKQIKDIWVFQSKGSGYNHINASDLKKMRSLLNCFSSADTIEMEIFNDSNTLPEIYPAEKVNISIPGFENHPGFVIKKDKTRSTGSEEYYQVLIPLDNAKMCLSIPRQLLNP